MNKAWLLACGAGLSLAYACGADPLYLNETDAVITIQKEGADYSAFDSYYLPDRIVDLCLQPESGTPTSEAIGGAAGGPSIDSRNCFRTDHASDEAILDAIEENLSDFGYERVLESDKDEADLAVLVGIVSRSSWSLARTYCYPTNYYRGCVDQSENPGIIVPYNSLVIQFVDVGGSEGDDLTSIWTAAIHPLQRISEQLGTSLGGGPASTKSKIWRDGIVQAFLQSGYLNEGGD